VLSRSPLPLRRERRAGPHAPQRAWRGGGERGGGLARWPGPARGREPAGPGRERHGGMAARDGGLPMRDHGVRREPQPATVRGEAGGMLAQMERAVTQAARAWRAGPRWGAMDLPSGSSSPVSSKTMTPLQRRLQPCSGKHATTRAASRSVASADGQDGWCEHIGFSGLWGRCVTVHMTSDARYQAERHSFEQVMALTRENPPFG
jgi:hypothetical protein